MITYPSFEEPPVPEGGWESVGVEVRECSDQPEHEWQTGAF